MSSSKLAAGPAEPPRAHAASAGPRRILTHEYFELRVEEECHRAQRYQSSFALLHLACDAAAETEQVVEALSASVRLTDVLAFYGPAEYEVLLADTQPAQAATVMARLSRNLGNLLARVGMASHGRDGRSADRLLSQARAHALGAAPAMQSTAQAASGPMHELHDLLARVAPSDLPVLVTGETGAGKERVAEEVHRRSRRAGQPFLCLNCAALAETLLESELFGHARGAFTGAQQAKPGLLETAHGGTVFLDEVGELPLSMQVKLLRVLEERKVRRVGELKAVPIDVRFVAATNRDLEAEIAAGTFRQDLYFRLNGITLVVPPLRERREEIEGLARTILLDAAARLSRPPPELSGEALVLLESYSWPGNVRELRNMIERAVLLCGEGVLLPRHLPVMKMSTPIAGRRAAAPRRIEAVAEAPAPRELALPQPEAQASLQSFSALAPEEVRAHVAAYEKARILEALSRLAGNQTEAARALGMSRRTLITRLESFGIARPRKK